MFRRMKKMRREEGTSMVELALVLGILGPLLLLGTAELSVLVYASIELTDATHAAAAYAAQYYIANSGSGLPTQTQVTAAATNDAPELLGMLKSGTSFNATMATGCGTGSATTGNSVPSCGSNLPYVQVTSTVTVVPLFQYLKISSLTMTSKAQVNLVN